MDPCYSVNTRDPQRLALLFIVMALGALFDPSLPAGAQSEPFRLAHIRPIYGAVG